MVVTVGVVRVDLEVEDTEEAVWAEEAKVEAVTVAMMAAAVMVVAAVAVA